MIPKRTVHAGIGTPTTSTSRAYADSPSAPGLAFERCDTSRPTTDGSAYTSSETAR